MALGSLLLVALREQGLGLLGPELPASLGQLWFCELKISRNQGISGQTESTPMLFLNYYSICFILGSNCN